MVLRFTACALLVASLLTSVTGAQPRTLTTALEIRSLTPAEAESGIPVKLRGVIVHVENRSALFLQDETSTTFFRLEPGTAEPSVGDVVEFTSKTRMGLYLPGVDYTSVQVVGRRALPPGIPAQYDDLFFGRFHYRRVVVEGIIRSVEIRKLEDRTEQGEFNGPAGTAGEDITEIRLAMGSQVIDAHLEQPPPAGVSFVGRRVRITGLAAGVINKRRQLVKPSLRVLDWHEIELLSAAPSASEVALISAKELLAYRITGRDERRVRVAGVVTAVFPEQVFLHQGPVAFGARLSRATALAVGDRVMIAGFPEIVRSGAVVFDAEVLSREPGAPPPAESFASPDKLEDKHDGALVSVRGLVRHAFQTEDGIALVLATERNPIQARIPAGTEMPLVGARVNVTGIAQVEIVRRRKGFEGDSSIVSLLARAPGDLVVLQSPSWWNARRLAVGLGLLGGVTALAGLWIALLRGQVRRQTEALRSRIESEAALEERHRIAREFHDTLEQELAGVSLRLDALATRTIDEKGQQLISASRNLVSRIQLETRDLIRDLRDSSELEGDLAAALRGVAARQAEENAITVTVDASSQLPSLPAATVHDLRMIAREAITNAIKHGSATRVAITAESLPGSLRLRITDDGCGFDPARIGQNRRGHFGCAGIRERARKSRADVSWTNAAPRGATVEVILPLPDNGGSGKPPRIQDASTAQDPAMT